MKEVILKIIGESLNAPSGENCQPWRFKVNKDNTIDLILLTERDESLYSWGQRASYMANGALLENIKIVSSYYGFKPEISFFPNENDHALIARIKLIQSNSAANALYPFVKLRVTNRKKYKHVELSKSQISELTSCTEGFNNVNIFFKNRSHDSHVLANAGSTNEKVMMSNEYLHKFFFSHINWTKKEDDEKKIGFFIDTLELPPPAKLGFKIFSNWKYTKFFNKFGLSNFIGKQNASIYSTGSGIGIITIPNLEITTFIEAGMVLEKLWLTVTKLGLSFQPLSGIIFFMYRIINNDTSNFSVAQVKLIRKAYNDILDSFGVSDNEYLAFMFRIGSGGSPTAKSSRFNVNQVTEFV